MQTGSFSHFHVHFPSCSYALVAINDKIWQQIQLGLQAAPHMRAPMPAQEEYQYIQQKNHKVL